MKRWRIIVYLFLLIGGAISSSLAQSIGADVPDRDWELSGGQKMRVVNQYSEGFERQIVILPSGDQVYLEKGEYISQLMRSEDRQAVMLLISTRAGFYSRLVLLMKVSNERPAWMCKTIRLDEKVQSITSNRYWVEFLTNHTSPKIEGAIHYMETSGYSRVVRQLFSYDYQADALTPIGSPILNWSAEFKTSK